jgi:tRNA(adenine34) deaminase
MSFTPLEPAPASLSNDAITTPTDPALDEHFMHLALKQAHLAASAGEVPVGAILVSPTGEIIAQAGNATETSRDPTAHAEMLCIRHAAQTTRAWRLSETTLYVTLEPCPMCAGAALQSRLRRVVYGARNPLLGADGSWVSILSSSSSSYSRISEEEDGEEEDHVDVDDNRETGNNNSNSNININSIDSRNDSRIISRRHPFHPDMMVTRGVLADECSEVMKTFFRRRRMEGQREREEVV